MQQETFLDVDGLRLHVMLAGPADGPLVVLLHGFPEFWYGWRKQIAPLAEAGFRVMAPDQRGYNTSDKPAGVSAYRLDALASDVVGLMDAVGRESAVIIGHDWGAAVGWWTALRYPRRIARLAVLNVPHPVVLLEHLRRDFRQMLKSSYMAAFQIPALPEALMRIGGGRPMFASVRRTGRPDAFDEKEEPSTTRFASATPWRCSRKGRSAFAPRRARPSVSAEADGQRRASSRASNASSSATVSSIGSGGASRKPAR